MGKRLATALIALSGLFVSPFAFAAPAAGFQVVASPRLPDGSQLNAIATSGENQAWAVGQQPSGANNAPVVEHWNGRSWQVETLPVLPPVNGHPIIDAALTSVSVTASGEVWAAGQQRADVGKFRPLVLHGNGSTWTVLPIPGDLSPTLSYGLYTISALDSKHVWVAGSGSFHHGSMFLMSWDGAKWTEYGDLPLPGGYYGVLNSVKAVAPNDVWVTGQAVHNLADPVRSEVATYHFDGTAWSLVAMPIAPSGVVGSGDSLAAAGGKDVWLAGSTFTDPSGASTIERWNGKAWTVGPALPTATTVSQVAVDARHRAWVAGLRGDVAAAMHLNGRQWTEISLPVTTTSSIGIATTTSGRTAWAFANTPSPVLLRCVCDDGPDA